MVLPFKNEAQEGCAKKNEFIKLLNFFLELYLLPAVPPNQKYAK